MDRPVWLLTDARMDAHASAGHPERPERREAMAAGVRDAAGAALVEPSVDGTTDERIHAVHDPDYLAALDRAEAAGGGWLDPDTYLVSGSMLAARLAAGATIGAAFAVADGDASVAVAAVRPPGHHASAARGSGFCLLNNVAVAVGALRSTARAQRIGIVDWDVHHGDGTQELFDADPDVIYASTHQHPFYPGTGLPHETGVGAAAGTMHNHPLMAGAGDEEFVAAWTDDLLPAIERFAPDAILVSAGYDAHRADPLASLEVTEAGFGEVARLLGALGARLGLNGVALTFEGGYDLDAVRASAAATVRGLLEGRRSEARV
ncbi:MAG TPA: histone deacetylase [Candidatus Limnocylindria bacterium]|nr:histone deacetylase [Candidatus Limnocylindria bacterium]